MNTNRFLKNRLKFISAIATGAMIMSSILPYPALAVDSNLYEVTENGERETIVTYESAAYFAVTIPKKITLDGKTKSAGYSITVRGDIPSDAKVGVSPKDQIPGIEGVNFYMQEQAITRKADVVATVIQEATEWASNEVTETGTAKNGSISAPDLTAGKWQGAFIFDINLIEYSESHTHNYVDGVCTGCGEKDPNAEVHTHTYTENIIKEATCTETGEKSLTCECGDTKTESIPMKEHNYVDGECVECGEKDPNAEVHTHTYTENITKDATCTAEGEKTLTCECGDTKTESIPAIGHNYIDEVCTECSEINPNHSHNYVNEVCTICNELNPNHEHEYTETITKNSTCIEMGEKNYTCICGNSYTDTIDLVNHNYENGRMCSICNVEMEAGYYDANDTLIYSWDKYGINDDCSKCRSVINTNSSIVKVIIPNGVATIANQSFWGCSNLTHIDVPNTVTTIQDHAFDNCSGLTNINLSNNLQTIGESAFAFCVNLDNVNIPNTVTTIEKQAFNNCSGLTNIKLSNNLQSIGDDAFSGCSSLTDITIPGTVTNMGRYVFRNCTGLKNVIISEGITFISGDFIFYQCSNLEKVTLSSGLLNIPNSMFSGCKQLSDITIPNSVETIGENAFSNCVSLDNIEIPNKVTNIAYGTFFGCNGLENVVIPNSVTAIASSAFSCCYNLNNLIVPNNVTTIGSGAFYGVPHITYNGTSTGSPWGAKSIN